MGLLLGDILRRNAATVPHKTAYVLRSDGDRIAVSGIQELRDGSRVRPRPSRRHLAGAAPEEPGT